MLRLDDSELVGSGPGVGSDGQAYTLSAAGPDHHKFLHLVWMEVPILDVVILDPISCMLGSGHGIHNDLPCTKKFEGCTLRLLSNWLKRLASRTASPGISMLRSLNC